MAAEVQADPHGSLSALWEPHARQYSLYRPSYPTSLLQAVFDFAALPRKILAVDVGAGNGQVRRRHWASRRALPLRGAPRPAPGACCACRTIPLTSSSAFPSPPCLIPQLTAALAKEFESVLGVDASAGQLAHAQRTPNIVYRVAPAEATGVSTAAADLVTAATCIHWWVGGRVGECVGTGLNRHPCTGRTLTGGLSERTRTCCIFQI